jgi:uncharacterized coiled-coil DUF342 family protein
MAHLAPMVISQEEYDGLRKGRLRYKNEAADYMREVEVLRERLALEKRYRDTLRAKIDGLSRELRLARAALERAKFAYAKQGDYYRAKLGVGEGG